MENINPIMGNKRVPEISAESLDPSSRKIKKKNVNQNNLTASSERVGFPGTISTDTKLTDKMTNIAKLRQQFIQEIKAVELSLKETIKDLKHKIFEANKKNDFMTEKLREANQVLCSHAQTIFEKEQEYESLREKIKEFYEYQKILIENMEDISDTICTHENLSIKLEDQFMTVLMAEDTRNETLEREIQNIIPDENLSKEFKQLHLEITADQKDNYENENKAQQLELEIKKVKLKEEKDVQDLKDLDKKITQIETRIQSKNQEKKKKKNDLISEVEKMDKEIKLQDEESAKLDTQILELKMQLEKNRNSEKENEKKIKEVNDEINLLLKQKLELDDIEYNEDQQGSIHLEKLQEQLKTAQDELESENKRQKNIIGIIQKKISEVNEKLKNFEILKSKIEKYETDIKKEEESIAKISKQFDGKKLAMNDEFKIMNNKALELKKKKNQADSNLTKSEKNLKLLEKELSELKEKLKSKPVKQNIKQLSSKVVNQYDFPKLFASEETGAATKSNNKKASYYTPMMGNDDLEIDELPIEEQFSRLTQTPASSYSGRKKFFSSKGSTPSQKPRKESTPRGRGRSKK